MTETSTQDPVYNIQEYRRRHAQFLSGAGLWIHKRRLETGSNFKVFYEPSLALISKLTQSPSIDVEFFIYEFGPGTHLSRNAAIGHLIVAVLGGTTCFLCHYRIKPSYANLTLQQLMLAIGSLAHWAEDNAKERPILIYCRPEDDQLRRKLAKLGFRTPYEHEILIQDPEILRRFGVPHTSPNWPIHHWRDVIHVFDHHHMKAAIEPLLDPMFAIDRRYPIYFAGEVYDTQVTLNSIYALDDPIWLHKRYNDLQA